MNDERGELNEDATMRSFSRRAVVGASLTLAGAAAILAASPLGTSRVAAQDDGLGAGGRQGGDDGAGASLPTAEIEDGATAGEGLGAGGRQDGDDAGGGGGRRRRQDEAAAPAGVGAGGRMDGDPMVMHMPDTGVGDAGGTLAPVLLAATAVGAATVALRTRVTSTTQGDAPAAS